MKNHTTSTLVLVSALLLGACGANEVSTSFESTPAVEGPFVRIGSHDTFLKASTADSSTLQLTSQKCAIKRGGTLLLKAEPTNDGKHIFVELRAPLNGCEITSGYLFSPDVKETGNADAKSSNGATGTATQTTTTPNQPASTKADSTELRRVCKAPSGLNLRAEPNTESAIITVVPMDYLLLLQGETKPGFVKVAVKNNTSLVGWVSADFVCYPLTKEQISNGQSGYDSTYAYSLRNFIIQNTEGRLYGMGRCYEYVWRALRLTNGEQIEALPVPATSAYQFGDWVDANPTTARAHLKLERRNVTRWNAPVGSIFVWNRGQAGYNYTHGHIEVKIDANTACSDGCWGIRSGDSEPRIYVPVE